MSIIAQEQRRLDNIYTMYSKTSGEMREMWRKKWYELVKQIGRKIRIKCYANRNILINK